MSERNISCSITNQDNYRIVDITLDCLATGTDLNAVLYHINEIVKKAGIVNWLEKQWIKIYQEPVIIIQTLDEEKLIEDIDELDILLNKLLDRLDRRNKTPNNWESVLIHGILRTPLLIPWLKYPTKNIKTS